MLLVVSGPDDPHVRRAATPSIRASRNPEDVQTFRIFDARRDDPDRATGRTRIHEQIAERLAQVPGVSSVGLTSAVTMDGNDSNDPIFVEEFPTPAGQMPPLRRYKWIGPGYVETMGNQMLAGRALTWDDFDSSCGRSSWSRRSSRASSGRSRAQAIGKRIRQHAEESVAAKSSASVGDERDNGVHRPAPAIVYWPMR